MERFIAIGNVMPDHMFPAALKYWAAHTGRFGGSDRTNLQNLKQGGVLRATLKAPDGYKVIAADYSQIEARITATLAGQTDLMESFASGEDVYCTFGSYLYGYTVTKESHAAERKISKMALLGLQYGMGVPRFYDTLSITDNPVDHEFAARAVAAYRERYRKIKQMWYEFDDLIRAMATGKKLRYGCVVTDKDKLVISYFIG